ncbi:ATP-binding cassette domain-containing protein [Chitinispirillales bacterium ANBcel5]|uniref:ABC transporter ATP-binding protein n=1 Tax=Cellulosispirillum alkaliphilum TaxID=3039283 RepID=UPI002A4EEF31|nr:ATP-binding cassette domain-containing protein [Chitinispirillales bacterium ANBcel5]
MIRFEHVKFFRNDRVILKDISFSIGLDERVAIVGGSGEGKTTILKLILRLLEPDQGKIIIDDEDVTSLKESHLKNMRRKFSIVFQDGALFDSLNVKENVAYYLREFSKLSEPQIDEKVKQLLNLVGIENAEEMMPEELSGGMQRRVAIARSLAMHEPKMFLYDEPTSDLDPMSAAKITNVIKELAKAGSGFIMVTHEISDALKTAQRFMFLKNGFLQFDGSREEFLNSKNSELNEFLLDWKNQS